jgi:hypothetical protein
LNLAFTVCVFTFNDLARPSGRQDWQARCNTGWRIGAEEQTCG